jgi:hypothetical protein
MNWGEFVDAVESHLAVESNRRGMEAFRSRFMRNAVLDLQRYIRGYREGNSTVYTTASLTDEGQAQVGEFPTGAKPKAMYIYSVDADLDNPLCYRYRLQFYPWLQKQDLICGRLNFTSWLGSCCATSGCPTVTLTADQQAAWTSKAYVYTIGPFGRNFLIYPKVTASTRLVLFWDGYHYVWSDSDTINFPEEASEAVAAYVQWKISRSVDKNIGLSKEFESDWLKLRLSLYRDFQETQDAEQKEEAYGTDVIAPPTNFSEFDAQSIPFLRTITTIPGTAVTALAAVSTVSMDTPTTVMVLIGGALQLWMLDAGSTATGPGVQRPADWSASNLKVWIQLS